MGSTSRDTAEFTRKQSPATGKRVSSTNLATRRAKRAIGPSQVTQNETLTLKSCSALLTFLFPSSLLLRAHQPGLDDLVGPLLERDPEHHPVGHPVVPLHPHRQQ